MSKLNFSISKNKDSIEHVDWLFISDSSPIIHEIYKFESVENLVIFSISNNGLEFEFSNVENVHLISVDFKNDDIDYGVIRESVVNLDIDSDSIVYIDTTNLVFSVYSYLTVYLHDFLSINRLRFMYFEAKRYMNAGNYMFHNGSLMPVQLECFQEVESIKKELIIYLIGFEGSLTQIIDREREPASKIILNGFPSALLNFKDVSMVANSHLISNNYKVEYCTALNPSYTIKKLDEVSEKFKDEYQISIAVCGPTPSAIGALIYAILSENVKVLTIRPQKYNFEERDYKNQWIYSFDLM